MCSSILLGSAATGVCWRDIAGFAAFGAIVQTVCGQADVMLPLADGAVFFAAAVLFRFVAHGADDGTGHGGPPGKTVPEGSTCGKTRARMESTTYHGLSV